MRLISSGLVLLLGSMLLSETTHAEHHAHAEPVTSVGILVFDGVQIIDFTAPYEVFGQAGFGVYTVSADGEKVSTAMGLSVTPDYSFETMPAANIILVPGGDIEVAAADKQIKQWLVQQSNVSEHVVSVCTGSYILASAGLLDGLTATTFHTALDGLQESYPNIKVVNDVRFVDNGQVITSAGLSSGIDAALHVVSRVQGLERAKTVAMHLEYDWKTENGFVRATMADRHLPTFDVDWPKDTQLSRVYHYGDQQHWISRHEGSVALSQQQLAQLLSDSMEKDPLWSAVPADTVNQLAWKKIDGNSVVLLSLAFEVKEQNTTLSLELRVMPQEGLVAK